MSRCENRPKSLTKEGLTRAMTLNQSALLELTEAMRTADDGQLMRTLLHTILGSSDAAGWSYVVGNLGGSSGPVQPDQLSYPHSTWGGVSRPCSNRCAPERPTGCRVARGRFGQSRVNEVGELSHAGVVRREDHPQSNVYRLNCHVASGGIMALADQWNLLVKRMRADLDDWKMRVQAAWLFGSAARGAGPESDIDVLSVRSDSPSLGSAADEDQWESQLQSFTERVQMWSGNPRELLELTVAEIHQAVDETIA